MVRRLFQNSQTAINIDRLPSRIDRLHKTSIDCIQVSIDCRQESIDCIKHRSIAVKNRSIAYRYRSIAYRYRSIAVRNRYKYRLIAANNRSFVLKIVNHVASSPGFPLHALRPTEKFGAWLGKQCTIVKRLNPLPTIGNSLKKLYKE